MGFKQSQSHGKIYEMRIQKEVFNLTEEEMEKHLPTSHYDIEGVFNNNKNCPNVNISIKSSKSRTIDCGDIIRFLNSTNTKLICVKFEQVKKQKIAYETICFDLEEYLSLLEKSMDGDYINWYQRLEEYVHYIKNDLPKRGRVNQGEYPYLEKKKALSQSLTHFQINPKVDSKTQRRVQCSIRMGVLKDLSSFETFPGAVL